jgi:formyltetrahydrofolate deformylase
MQRFATITVIGRDKTGVIARVTNFLFQQKANIEALEEAVTRGQFSMAIQASWHDGQLKPATLKRGLNALGKELGMEMRLRLTEPGRKQRMALMVTREAACPEALLAAFRKGQLKQAEPVVMLGNRPDLKSLAHQHKLPYVHILWNDRKRAEKKALRVLETHEIDFVVLARFMKILSPDFVWRYKNKIINIHPSLLPSFPGPQAYRQAYEHGVKIAGVTAHFVSMQLDEGPVIAQESFHIKSGMTLNQIVAAGQQCEAKTLVKAVKIYLTKRLDVHWGVVKEV